ncbi:NAD(P)-binding protein [Cylindrobasidium torrendii FP15055 ss-10]|uniref:D-xylose 1-dehydrogenase (NADP(+), D-xylono-1,5-lactone-forming) n=1 Tax=Cylindrobasidium torrendii FP15055 ss-10 TaxID=1314674 RepID=A0A0D7BJ33_9AGAR|nr:NAD(P)-binding protein [Cylindrobasidium torrendii FP15055 ss-10]
MASILGFVRRVSKIASPPSVPKNEGALKFGILGAAAIGPEALIKPARSHADVVIYAVAARDKARAQEYADKHGITKVHDSYQDLLDDPEIDVVYNPLPNGLHFEWTAKALLAGKHVLLEKPATDTAEEARALFELAEKQGRVLLEAFHYRFHPAIRRLKEIILSQELGNVKSITTSLAIPKQAFGDDDIRYNHALGGGAQMDVGGYTLNALRYLASPSQETAVNPLEVLSASSITYLDPKIDRRTTATFSFPNDIVGTAICDFQIGWLDFLTGNAIYASVECEGGKIDMANFLLPTIWHSINVKPKGGKVRTEKVYTPLDGAPGEEWWTTYRYQLETFVNRVKGRDSGPVWIEKEDTLGNMEWIERVYAKTELGSRPASQFKVPTV